MYICECNVFGKCLVCSMIDVESKRSWVTDSTIPGKITIDPNWSWESDFHGIKTEWKQTDTWNGYPIYNLKEGSTYAGILYNQEEECYKLFTELGDSLIKGTLRECLEYYDKHFYKDDDMEETVTWKYTKDRGRLASNTGKWSYKDYIIFHNRYTLCYVFLKDTPSLATIFNHDEIHKVFEYANEYIKDPKHKERKELLTEAEALEKEAKQIREKATSL